MKNGPNCQLALILFFSLFGSNAWSAPIAKQIESYEQTRARLGEVEAARRKVLGSLYDVNLRMKRMSREKNNLTDQMFRVQSTVELTAGSIARLEKEIERQKLQIRKRLRSMYKLSGAGFVAVIFSQTNAADLDQFLKSLKRINDLDAKVIDAYRENVERLKTERQILHKEIQNILAIERRIKRQEDLLLNEHNQRNRIISELDKQHRGELKKFLKLQKDPELRNLMKAGFFDAKGRLPWPIDGILVQGFGPVSDHQFNIHFSHKGWLLQAPSETSVHAVFDGAVAFRGSIPRYGETIVLDHGDHYYTVYSGLSGIIKNHGDNVKALDKIAMAPVRAGTTQMYFEIRHFSDSQNPQQWLENKIQKQTDISRKQETEFARALSQESNP